MRLHLLSLTIFCTATISSGARASASYEFCVTRVADTKTEIIHAKMKFGDIDPGKEVARVLVSTHYKRADTKSVSVSDVSVACSGLATADEISVNATDEQLTTFGNQITSDPVSAAVTGGEIVAGVTVKTVQEVGKGASTVGQAVGDFFKHIFGG